MDQAGEMMLGGIVNRLVAERNRKGITQRKVARYCGVSNVHMNRIEKGHALPSWEVLYSWCFCLGYEPQVMLKRTDCGVRV